MLTSNKAQRKPQTAMKKRQPKSKRKPKQTNQTRISKKTIF